MVINRHERSNTPFFASTGCSSSMWQHNPTISKYSEQNGHGNSSLISSSPSSSSNPMNISAFHNLDSVSANIYVVHTHGRSTKASIWSVRNLSKIKLRGKHKKCMPHIKSSTQTKPSSWRFKVQFYSTSSLFSQPNGA